MVVKKYKNGNISLKRDLNHEDNLVECLVNSIDLDMIMLSESYESLGNFATYLRFYDLNTQKKYIVTNVDEEKFKYRNPIKLYAYELDNDEKEELERRLV